MFFRRKRLVPVTFTQKLDCLRSRGFQVAPAGDTGTYRVSRDGCAVVIAQGGDGAPVVAMKPGVLMGGGIGALVDGGFQKFFSTPDGFRKPALASELKSLHAFQEDLREALGLESLYNEALGTVSTFYLYDRVKDRDRGSHS